MSQPAVYPAAPLHDVEQTLLLCCLVTMAEAASAPSGILFFPVHVLRCTDRSCGISPAAAPPCLWQPLCRTRCARPHCLPARPHSTRRIDFQPPPAMSQPVVIPVALLHVPLSELWSDGSSGNFALPNCDFLAHPPLSVPSRRESGVRTQEDVLPAEGAEERAAPGNAVRQTPGQRPSQT